MKDKLLLVALGVILSGSGAYFAVGKEQAAQKEKVKNLEKDVAALVAAQTKQTESNVDLNDTLKKLVEKLDK